MNLYPAIDLKDGACVRLRQGDMAAATVFNTDPAAQALAFEAAGFRWLHLVDLNGAFAGKPVNAAAVRAILQATRLPVQLGGGIRDLATIELWLSADGATFELTLPEPSALGEPPPPQAAPPQPSEPASPSGAAPGERPVSRSGRRPRAAGPRRPPASRRAP